MASEQATALSTACTTNSIPIAISILSTNPELISEPLTWSDSAGQELNTPAIFIAIDYGHVELVKEMLQFMKGSVDTLKSGSGDYNALGWASWAGHLDIVKLLIEGEIDVRNVSTSLARNLLILKYYGFELNHQHLFAKSTHFNTKEAGAKVDEEALELSRESKHAAVTEYLLQHNIDLYSGLDGDADAIMEKACREGDLNMVRKLLDEGYEIEKCSLGPFYMAVKCGRVDVVQLFRERGVGIDLDMSGDQGVDKFKAIAEEMNAEGEDDNSLAEEEGGEKE